MAVGVVIATCKIAAVDIVSLVSYRGDCTVSGVQFA